MTNQEKTEQFWDELPRFYQHLNHLESKLKTHPIMDYGYVTSADGVEGIGVAWISLTTTNSELSDDLSELHLYVTAPQYDPDEDYQEAEIMVTHKDDPDAWRFLIGDKIVIDFGNLDPDEMFDQIIEAVDNKFEIYMHEVDSMYAQVKKIVKPNQTFKDTEYGDLTGKTYDGDIVLKKLTIDSLEGMPEILNGDLIIEQCYKLVSFESGPKKINGDLIAEYNNIESLVGIAKITGNIELGGNGSLQSLKGIQQKVFGDLNLRNCKLRSLEGGPKEVGGDFECNESGGGILKSLKGAPEKVGGNFHIGRQYAIKSLEGGPKEVGGDYIVSESNLISLKGAPQKVGGMFDIKSNPKITTLSEMTSFDIGSFKCDKNDNDLDVAFVVMKENPNIAFGDNNFLLKMFEYTDDNKYLPETVTDLFLF